jgi:hypothetical protein
MDEQCSRNTNRRVAGHNWIEDIKKWKMKDTLNMC